MFQVQTDLQLILANLRQFLCDVGVDAFFVELHIDFMLQLGLLVIAAHTCFDRLLVHQLAVDLNLQVGKIRFGALELIFRVHQRLRHGRIGHFENHRVWLDQMARANHDLIDARCRQRGDPVNIEWHKCAQAADFAQHRAALHRVGPDRASIHRRRRRLQPRQSQRYAGNYHDGDDDVGRSLDFFGFRV